MVADAEIYQDATHQLIANATIPMQLGWDKKFVAYASGRHKRPRAFQRDQPRVLGAMMNPRAVQGLAGNISMDIALSGPIKHPQANGGCGYRAARPR